jgi:hypothetical protein
MNTHSEVLELQQVDQRTDWHGEANRRIFATFRCECGRPSTQGIKYTEGGWGEERGEFITETHEKDNFTQCTALGYCVEHKVTPREKFRIVYL